MFCRRFVASASTSASASASASCVAVGRGGASTVFSTFLSAAICIGSGARHYPTLSSRSSTNVISRVYLSSSSSPSSPSSPPSWSWLSHPTPEASESAAVVEAQLPISERDIRKVGRVLTNTRTFREVPVDNQLLAHIMRLGFGRKTTKNAKQKFAKGGSPLDIERMLWSNQADANAVVEQIFQSRVVMRAAALHVDEFPVRNDDCETQPDAEVAFAGRSNVGKSSLLKALSLRGTRVSIADRPGTTRSVNFYDLGVYLSLVDLPGYGFAFAKPEQVQSWIDIMTEYFRQRVGLKRVILLLDARFGIKDSDVSLMRLLDECRVKYQVVLTKADLLKPVSLARRLWLVREELRQHHRYAMHDAIMLVSSQNRRGLQDLRKQLVALVPPKKVQRLKNRIARQEEIERTNESKSVALVDGMAESKEPEEKRPSLVDRVHGLMDELNSKYVRVGRRSGGVTQRQSRRHRNRVLSARRSVLRFDSSPAPSQTAASPTRITTKHRHGHAGSSRKSKSQSKRKRKRKSE